MTDAQVLADLDRALAATEAVVAHVRVVDSHATWLQWLP
jgi:hypothetical protein